MAPNDLLGLTGKRAFIVGGGQGMGLGSARFLSQAGCDIAVLDIDPAGARSVVEVAQAAGRRTHSIHADIFDTTAIPKHVEAVVSALGGLDILVTIVGQAHWSSALEVTEETWDLEHKRNLRYAFFTAQAAARSFIRRDVPGAITFLSSVSGVQSAPNHVGYGAAKGGLINVVKSLAVELAPKNIRVNSVAPGSTATPRVRAMVQNDETSARSVALIPMGRMAEPDEMGKAVLFLSSDLASYVTGQTLAVDGGVTAKFGFFS